MESLCILLRRITSPCRHSDIIAGFGSPVPVLSEVYKNVLDFVYAAHGPNVTQWNPTILSLADLRI